jgi:hypothetical protein
MLGHSSISITADTYGHLTDEGREDVAARLERALVGRVAAMATTSCYQAPPGPDRRSILNLEQPPEGRLEASKPDCQTGRSAGLAWTVLNSPAPVQQPSGSAKRRLDRSARLHKIPRFGCTNAGSSVAGVAVRLTQKRRLSG